MDRERGSALVEVVFLLVLLVLPVLYLVGTLGRAQAGAYAASAAAREAGRAFVTSPGEASAAARGSTAAGLVFDAHGFGAGQGQISVSCAAAPCLTPGASVTVDASVRVPLPLIPDFMRGQVPTELVLTSSHTEAVDEFRAP